LCSSPTLFAPGVIALRKAEGTSLDASPVGYAKADALKSCVAKANGCCAVYFIPVKTGQYPIVDESCSQPLGTVAVSGAVAGTLDPFTPVAVPPNLAPAADSKWQSWKTATQIDIALGVLSWHKTVKKRIRCVGGSAAFELALFDSSFNSPDQWLLASILPNPADVCSFVQSKLDLLHLSHRP
jgi:hypothetical protein